MSTVGTLYEETVKRGFGKLLAIANASNSAAIDFLAPIADPNFDTFLFDLENLQFASAGQTAMIRVSSDNGASWSAASYYWALSHMAHALTPPLPFYTANGGAYHQWASGIVDAGYPTQGYVFFYRGALATNGYKVMEWSGGNYCNAAGYGHVTNHGAGHWTGSGTVNGVRFYPNSGTIVSGSIRCYGLRKG